MRWERINRANSAPTSEQWGNTMDGPDTQQPGRMTWADYLNAVKNGPAPQYTPPTSATAAPNFWAPFMALFGGRAAPGGSKLPATPIDYGRIQSILNSGALEGGKAPVGGGEPPPLQPQPQAPVAPQPPQQTILQRLFSGAGPSVPHGTFTP